MEPEIEPMQQPIRKMVGRFLTPSERLRALEELDDFLKKHCPETLARSEGDYFPVRKVVGRTREAKQK